MIASTGTNARDLETAEEPTATPSRTAEIGDEPPKRSHLTRAVVDGENFDEGQYGTYASIILLVLGK